MCLSLIAPMCYRNYAIKSVLVHFLVKNEMPKRSFNVSYFTVLFMRINFYVEFLKLHFQGNDLNLRINH